MNTQTKKIATVSFKENTNGKGYEGRITVDGRHVANVEGRTTNSVANNYKKWCKRNGYKAEQL